MRPRREMERSKELHLFMVEPYEIADIDQFFLIFSILNSLT